MKPDPRQLNAFSEPLESPPPEPIALSREWRQCKRELGYAEKRCDRAEEAVKIARLRGLATMKLEQIHHLACAEFGQITHRMAQIEAMGPDLGFD